MAIAPTLIVFYDGACGLCSTEMKHYRSLADQRIAFIDIAAADFKAETFGKRLEEFQRELHVQDAEGRFFTGVEAFRNLWKLLPSPIYPLLSTFVGLPGIHLCARAGYAIFARYRHLLPSRHTSHCSLREKD